MGWAASWTIANPTRHEWRSVQASTPRFAAGAATAANKRFSSGVGRAVIVGAVDFEAPTFIARNSELQQNADTSLSCHHSNNDSTTLLDPKSLLIRSANLDLHIARITECFGVEIRRFFSGTRPESARRSALELN